MTVWQLVFLQLSVFIGLIVALRLLFYRHLRSAMQRLQTLHEETMVKEAQLNEELARARKERAAEVEKGREEATALLEAAQRSADTLRMNAEEQAKQDNQKLLTKGKEDVEKIRANLSSEIEARAIAFSLQMIRYTLTQRAHEDFQQHIVEDLIHEIEAVEQERFSITTTTATVTSSAPLTTDAQHRLRRVLSGKLGTDITLDARVDPALITGLVVQLGALVIDGSLSNKLRKAIAVLREHKNSP